MAQKYGEEFRFSIFQASQINFIFVTSFAVRKWKRDCHSFEIRSVIIYSHCHLTSSSDYRSNLVPSDSDRDCASRRDSDPPPNQHALTTSAHPSTLRQPARLSITAPSGGDSESGDGSHSSSPRASRRRTKIRTHSLTSLCLLSHHPFFSTFRECLFVLKKLISACNESSSPKNVGASRQSGRDNVWTVLTGQPTEHTPSIVLHDVKEIETWILRLLSAPVPIPGSTRIELEILSPTVHEPLLFALPDHTRFSLVDFPLHLPLELLGECLKFESLCAVHFLMFFVLMFLQVLKHALKCWH